MVTTPELHIQALCKQGRLDRAIAALQQLSRLPSLDDSTYHALLLLCSKHQALSHTKHIHALLSAHRPTLPPRLADCLAVAFAKCGALEDARRTLLALPDRSVFTWTAVISGYAECGYGLEALRMYVCMLEDGIMPDAFTFASLFKACSCIPDVCAGRKLHEDSCRFGFDSDVFVGNTLVSMYGKCRSIKEAEIVFTGMLQHDTISWNAMLSTYAIVGRYDKALQLYRQMQDESVIPDKQTFMVSLQSCGNLAETEEAVVKGQIAIMIILEIGEALHANVRRACYDIDLHLGSVLISMYGKCGSVVAAECVFTKLLQHDVVSWSGMLLVFVEQGQGDKALHLYWLMHEEGINPDQQACAITLQACVVIAEGEESILKNAEVLEIGYALHADALKKGFVSDIYVGNILVSLYGKCGSLAEAENMFSGLLERNVVSWNGMLSLYVEQGQGERALILYEQMQDNLVSVDTVTLLCILQACDDTGNIRICHDIHFCIVSHCYDMNYTLANTLIQAYGNCSCMIDALAIFDGSPHPDVVPWTACMAGYAREGNFLACQQMYHTMLQANIKPCDLTFLALLTACSHAGLADEGIKYFGFLSRDFGFTQELNHYTAMLDLLGRAGDFSRVELFLWGSLLQADWTIWLCLLATCCIHGNLELGNHAFARAVLAQPKEGAAYILMSHMCANINSLRSTRGNAIQGIKKLTKEVWGQELVEHEQKLT